MEDISVFFENQAMGDGEMKILYGSGIIMYPWQKQKSHMVDSLLFSPVPFNCVSFD